MTDDEKFEEFMNRARREWSTKSDTQKKAIVSSFSKFKDFCKDVAGWLWDSICDILDSIGDGLTWLWEKITSWF